MSVSDVVTLSCRKFRGPTQFSAGSRPVFSGTRSAIVAVIVPSDGVFASPVGPLTGELVEVRLRVVRVDVVEVGWTSLVAGLELEGVLIVPLAGGSIVSLVVSSLVDAECRSHGVVHRHTHLGMC